MPSAYYWSPRQSGVQALAQRHALPLPHTASSECRHHRRRGRICRRFTVGSGGAWPAGQRTGAGSTPRRARKSAARWRPPQRGNDRSALSPPARIISPDFEWDYRFVLRAVSHSLNRFSKFHCADKLGVIMIQQLNRFSKNNFCDDGSSLGMQNDEKSTLAVTLGVILSSGSVWARYRYKQY